jgi:hypothetical protein
MASIGRLIIQIPKRGHNIVALRTMSGNPAPAGEGGHNFTLTETQQEVSIFCLILKSDLF